MYRVLAEKPEGKRLVRRTNESGTVGLVLVLGVKLWEAAVTGEAKNKLTVPFTLVAGMLAEGQYPEGPATGHLGTGFTWFPCVCL